MSRRTTLTVARYLNDSGVDVVSIQHEYGIWGGEDGAYVLDFVDALRVPVVTTLHTVLRTPTPEQRRILTAPGARLRLDRGDVRRCRVAAHPRLWR